LSGLSFPEVHKETAKKKKKKRSEEEILAAPSTSLHGNKNDGEVNLSFALHVLQGATLKSRKVTVRFISLIPFLNSFLSKDLLKKPLFPILTMKLIDYSADKKARSSLKLLNAFNLLCLYSEDL